MASLLTKSAICLRSLENSLSKLRLGPNFQQTCDKYTLNRPRLRNPTWFVRKDRTLHKDQLTLENQMFVKDVVHDNFGAPAFIKGVQTYESSAKSLVKMDELPATQWTPKTKRTGLIARKIGQYPLWLKDGTKIRTTLLQVVDNHVIKYTPPEEFEPARKPLRTRNKLGCLLVGAESADPTLLTKDYCGLFRDSGVMPKRRLARFFVSPEAALLPGTPLDVRHFKVGSFVDIRGKTIDRGFQGVVKRHGFKGMPASHGVTKTHRRPGNIGGGGEKGRVWPGTKMPGHMGNRYRVLKGLRIWRINTKYNVMWVQGSAIAGETNSIVYIYDTILPLRRLSEAPAFPTYFENESEDAVEDIWDDQVHDFSAGTIQFQPEN